MARPKDRRDIGAGLPVRRNPRVTIHGFWPGIVSGQGQGPGPEAGILLGEIPGATFKVLRRIGAIDAEASRGRLSGKLPQRAGVSSVRFGGRGEGVGWCYAVDGSELIICIFKNCRVR